VTDHSDDLPTLTAGRWTDAHADPPATAPLTDPPPPDPAPAASGPGAPGRRGRVAGVAILVALVVGGIAFVGTLAALDAHDNNRSVAAGSKPIPVQPTDPDAGVLGSLIVQQSDVPKGVTVELLPNGTDAVTQPTLDLCNGTYPSESERRARRQVVASSPTGTGGLSPEAVLYRNPAAAVHAFTDLKSVVAKCPAHPVVSPVGEATVTTRFNTPPDKTWRNVPTVDRLAYDLTTTDSSGQTSRTVAVYLKRGRVLMGIYFTSPGVQQVSVQGKTAIPDIVNIFAERLAKLPPRVVNGPPA